MWPAQSKSIDLSQLPISHKSANNLPVYNEIVCTYSTSGRSFLGLFLLVAMEGLGCQVGLGDVELGLRAGVRHLDLGRMVRCNME